MPEKLPISQEGATKASDNAPPLPKLLASSQELGWEGIAVQAYHEPAELEWSGPGSPDSSLILVARGSLHMEHRPVNGSWSGKSFYQGDLLLQPGVTTASELHWKGLSSEPLHLLYIHLSQELLSRTAQELTKHDPARLDLIGHAGFHDPLLSQLALALWRELEQSAPAGKLYGQAAAQMLAVHLLRHYTAFSIDIQERSQGFTPRQMNHLVDFILAHLSENLSLETLAQQVGFSPYHFARLFQETTGKSPHQFVKQQRIERAKKLLRETDVPLAQVALESGFSNQSHLTRVFKHHLNLTPRVYRHDRSISAPF
ncbi:AraC family transcriptional regulator [Ktedonosporobacter rubrisoli]|uniref:AraC family transcriptional regulator n=1 Tax=Ktedonosporobacter rubrisoli TaxID=2509675 RepID=A0A4P6JL03_KTERU|nr:AraC family transcriptional regulator [Ktedonosporobacter rubrisoli]QBD75753.1 AraC family transcriptional regulator [Ktedonosporobacter rubrisoli]